MNEIRWCAIGDSFTYLNDHLDETGYRVTKGYLSRIREKIPELKLNNIGINGSTFQDWIAQKIPEADLYTVLLGTNDWHWGTPLGSEADFSGRTAGTILGNLGIQWIYVTLPLISGNCILAVQMTLIGLALSVFRQESLPPAEVKAKPLFFFFPEVR